MEAQDVDVRFDALGRNSSFLHLATDLLFSMEEEFFGGVFTKTNSGRPVLPHVSDGKSPLRGSSREAAIIRIQSLNDVRMLMLDEICDGKEDHAHSKHGPAVPLRQAGSNVYAFRQGFIHILEISHLVCPGVFQEVANFRRHTKVPEIAADQRRMSVVEGLGQVKRRQRPSLQVFYE